MRFNYEKERERENPRQKLRIIKQESKIRERDCAYEDWLRSGERQPTGAAEVVDLEVGN